MLLFLRHLIVGVIFSILTSFCQTDLLHVQLTDSDLPIHILAGAFHEKEI